MVSTAAPLTLSADGVSACCALVDLCADKCM
jgi:hypothetical protein